MNVESNHTKQSYKPTTGDWVLGILAVYLLLALFACAQPVPAAEHHHGGHAATPLPAPSQALLAARNQPALAVGQPFNTVNVESEKHILKCMGGDTPPFQVLLREYRTDFGSDPWRVDLVVGTTERAENGRQITRVAMVFVEAAATIFIDYDGDGLIDAEISTARFYGATQCAAARIIMRPLFAAEAENDAIRGEVR